MINFSLIVETYFLLNDSVTLLDEIEVRFGYSGPISSKWLHFKCCDRILYKKLTI